MVRRFVATTIEDVVGGAGAIPSGLLLAFPDENRSHRKVMTDMWMTAFGKQGAR